MAELNGLGQFRTTIDGLDIDFLHIRSPEPDQQAARRVTEVNLGR